jgi:hypothetical protein
MDVPPGLEQLPESTVVVEMLVGEDYRVNRRVVKPQRIEVAS